MKRAIDVILCSIGLVVLSPLLLLLMVVVCIASASPPIYSGVRVGRYGRDFRVFKYRSMPPGAELCGPSATANDDPRLTWIGKFLRRHKLDELPQILNVLLGDMSLVGPRPEVRKYVAMYTPEQKRILELRPGITDWATIWNADQGSVLAGSTDPEADYEALIRPTKIELQLKYLDTHSTLMDLKIICYTILKLIRGGWIPKEIAAYGTPADRKVGQYPVAASGSSMPAIHAPQTGLPAIAGGTPIFSEPVRFLLPTLPKLRSVLRRYMPAYDRGLITNGALVSRLEESVAERLNVRHCVAVSSCTSGLCLVVRALGLEGEVIVPAMTFFATAHALLWNGLQPVLADCRPDNWNIDPADVERRITPRTSAILAVHLYGNPCAVEELSEVAARHGLKLIFDAAHAFGSEYRGRRIGQFGDAEVFSLSPTKILVAGEGGLVTTNDATLARLLRTGRNYGDAGTYDCELLGMNGRMSEFHAAMALSGLELVEMKVRRYNRIARLYRDRLSGLEGISFPEVRSDDVSTFKDYCIHVESAAFGCTRDELVAALRAENIEARRYFYPPLNRQLLYREFAREGPPLPHTDRLSDGVLSLPIYHSLEDRTVNRVADAIQRLARYYDSQKSRDREMTCTTNM
jgi:dTDP-4-amino-4,6-dideoxygalactose transaminase/lipopolysaccharide/colanic/teichoic acid biosynthesis glycosyltransferase